MGLFGKKRKGGDRLLQKEDKPDVRPVTLQAVGAPASSRLDSTPRFYMNIGSWTNGQTTFGLVSGNEAALCCWLPHGDRKQQFDSSDDLINEEKLLPDGDIHRFIKAARTYQTDRGAVSGAKVLAAFKLKYGYFVMGSRLLVFFPDMHLTLFKGHPCDAFVREYVEVTRGQESVERPVSLEDDLADMLSFLKHHGKQRGVTRIVTFHLGDLFEVCHTQAILDLALRQLLENKEVERDWLNLRDKLTDLYNPKWALQKFGEKFHKEFKLWGDVNIVDGDRRLDPWDWRAIEDRIRAQFPKLDWSLLCGLGDEKSAVSFGEYLRGNHDMDKDHDYLKLYHDSGKRKDSQRTGDKKVDWKNRDDLEVGDQDYTGTIVNHRQVVTDQRVRWEHGHAFDPYNHRTSFFSMTHFKGIKKVKKLYGGWRNTRDFIQKFFKNPGKGGGWMVDMANRFGLQVYARNRAKAIFKQHPRTTLVILGHTHIAEMRDYSDGHLEEEAEDQPAVWTANDALLGGAGPAT